MKLLGILFFATVLAAIHTGQGVSQPHQLQVPVRKERLWADVKTLTDIVPARNYRNLVSLNKAADHIHAEFSKLKCTVAVQHFTVNGKEYRNVICSYGEFNRERIIVGAHYDVAGDTPGADDNASGVAGLLELARIVNELNPSLDRRIDFVAYSLEEPPFFRSRKMGSYFHAKSLSDSGVTVKAMVCLESIGFFTDAPSSQKFPGFFFRWFYPTEGNFVIVVGKWGQGELVHETRRLMSAASAVPVESITAPSIIPGIDFSDHLSYWRRGYPAVMVTDTAFYRNPNYHELSDTIDTIDFNRMAEVVKGVYWAIIHFK